MMKIQSSDLQHGASIATRFAFGKPDGQGGIQFSDNISPALAWSEAPAATRSFAVLCVDPDVPADASDVNVEGRVIPLDAPRTDFYHWVLIDLPPGVNELPPGAGGSGVTSGGKKQKAGPHGGRQGLNDYTRFMAGSDMAGDYYGYDGPCPPCNDLRMHHYTFQVYALDIDRLPLAAGFTGHDVQRALQGHVLASAALTGLYTLNRQLLAGRN